MPIIETRHLSKIFHLYPSPKARLREMFSLRGKKYHQAFRALDDVSFRIEKGQSVGIIGVNGSGKSTLLKLICGVLQPSGGELAVNGKDVMRALDIPPSRKVGEVLGRLLERAWRLGVAECPVRHAQRLERRADRCRAGRIGRPGRHHRGGGNPGDHHR